MDPMTFNDRLEKAQLQVEARLTALFPSPTWAGDPLEIPPRLTEAMRHAVLGGGKRFRPFLVLESARLFEADERAAIDVAAALECIHCYSLVHDDLPSMDNDETRRGRATVWKAYDEWTAILAGDALLTLAFEILADLDASPPIKLRLIRELARASGQGGMVGGQVIDLEADKLGTPTAPTIAYIRRLQSMKTGALIRFGCIAGPILANRPQNDVAALEAYGDHLGLAFQISDDLLDATGDAAVVGKAVAKDAASGKATLVSLMGLDAARDALDEAEAAAITALSPYDDRADVLRDAARFMAKREA
jgi:farnesyl diphosphate synthase